LFGVFALNTNPVSASVRVARNDLRNWAGSAIAAIGSSGATIDNNSIAPGSFANQIPGGTCAVPTGLGSATGISLTGTVNSLVKSNTIELAATAASLFLGTGANGNTFRGNFPTVEGNIAGNSIAGQE
jgi:hypothetical protein